MADIILFHFEQSEVRYVGDGFNHAWIAQDICNVLGLGNTSQALTRLDEDEKDEIILTDTIGREQKMLTVNEPGLYTLILGSRKPIAKRFKRWVVHEVLPSIRKTGNYSLEQEKSKLEKQFRPEITAKDRMDALKILKMGSNDKSYIQRVSVQMARSICPDIEVPAANEMLSLPTTKALLTPTDIAVEIGVFCKSNPEKGDARWVNKKLEELGYQEKISGQWSATSKADGLCDRKPVDTNSRTQHDQLKWSADIVSVLQEHVPRI